VATQSECWRSIADELGFRVIAPFIYTSSNGEVEFAAMLPDFGGESGIVTDPDWEKIELWTNNLRQDGFGFSCIEVDRNADGIIDVLQDWTWTSPAAKPAWLKSAE
jgi:hypothetical protein